MAAAETIQRRIEELNRKMAQYQECISHHQGCITVFSKAVAESQSEVRELSELVEVVDGAKALSSRL